MTAGSELEGRAAARTLSLTVPSAALGALALAGALAAAGVLPATAATVAGAVLFLAVGALPLLARLSPVEPSLLKLLTVSALASPVLATTVYLLVHLVARAEPAMVATFAALVLLQLAGLGRRVGLPRTGRATAGALAISLLCAALVVVLLFRGSAPRASYHGLLHSTLVLAVDRGVPPGNPFFAGGDLGYYWFWHGMGALVARGLSVAPTVALALLNLWAAAVLPLALYFTAAPLFRGGRRELIGVVLALFGLNALGGWLWAARGLPWHAPHSNRELLEVLEAATGAWDIRLAFGFSKFGNLSSYPASLALFAGGTMAAVHAIRSGARPWPGSAGFLMGASLVVNPVVGGLGIACAGLAYVAFGTGMRLRLLAPLAAWAIPGALLTLRARASYSGESISFAWHEGGLWGTVAPVLLLLVPVVFLRRGRDHDASEEGRRDRRGLGLLLILAILPLALHLVLVLPYDNQYKLVRVAALPLALLAGAGLESLLERGGVARIAGGVLGLVLALGMLLGNALGFRSYVALAGIDLPLVEEPLALSPLAGPGDTGEPAELAAVYRGLRALADRAGPQPILVVNTVAEAPSVYGDDPPHAFTEPTRNLQGHEAAPFTALELWCDRPSQLLAASTPGWRERMDLVWRLYRGTGELSRGDFQSLAALGRPVLVLVTSSDLAARPDLADVLLDAGFREGLRAGDTAVYAWPESFAAGVGEPVR